MYLPLYYSSNQTYENSKQSKPKIYRQMNITKMEYTLIGIIIASETWRLFKRWKQSTTSKIMLTDHWLDHIESLSTKVNYYKSSLKLAIFTFAILCAVVVFAIYGSIERITKSYFKNRQNTPKIGWRNPNLKTIKQVSINKKITNSFSLKHKSK